jgi:hypothetical protein
MYNNPCRCAANRIKGSAFPIQQILLDMQASSVTHQFAVGADYAVAGNNDGDRIAMIGHAHRPAGLVIAYGDCNVLIGTCFPIGNILQCFPYL